MIIWGARTHSLDLGEMLKRHCPNCEKERPFRLYLRYRHAHLYWVFGWVTDEKYLILCEVCQRGLEVPKKEIVPYLKMRPIPFTHRFGCLILVALIGGIVLFGALAGLLNSVRSRSSEPTTASRKTKPDSNILFGNAGMIVVDVAGARINIPSPRGLFRFDGKSDHVDSMLKATLPPTHKILAVFGTEADLASTLMDKFPETGRQLFAESLVKTGYFTNAAWARVKSEFRADLQKNMEKVKSSEIWPRIESGISQGASQDLGASVDFKIGDMIPLDIFEETANSICYSELLKARVRIGEAQEPITVIIYEAGAMAYVRERIVFLYASSVFKDNADIDWTRSSLRQWRDDVVAANR